MNLTETVAKPQVRQLKDYSDRKHSWCPGCGDTGVLSAIMRWCHRNNIDPSHLVDSTGIGCSSKISEYHKCNGHHWLHGRSLPIATAIKVVNQRLIVMNAGGDGDGGAIGMEHFVHTCRRNPNITYIIMDNQVYGLTKGQLSPTGHIGLVTPTSPRGAKDQPIDFCEVAIIAGATFVARGYSYNQEQLAKILDEAFNHIGLSFVDILSPCPTYHREPAYDQIKNWFDENVIDVLEADRTIRESVVSVESVDPQYNPQDRGRVLITLSLTKNIEWETKDYKGQTISMKGKLPTGILYIDKTKPTFEQNLGLGPNDSIADLDISIEKNKNKLLEFFEAFK
jgi:2-oxoglutarate ferredoxin oxidoreductase subunit beta